MEKTHVLVVIDHGEARVYRAQIKGIHAEILHPHDPHHIRSHLTHRSSGYAGQRAPEDAAYYRQVAAVLVGVDQILIVGHGKGHSSAKLYLLKYLAKHHHDVLDHVVAVETINHPTENQLLAHARDFFEHLKEADES